MGTGWEVVVHAACHGRRLVMGYFGAAINRLDKDHVRVTFREANQRCGRRVDLTNLSKYRNGQHPSSELVGYWIPMLAHTSGIDEGELWAAWKRDADARRAAARRSSIVSTFGQLTLAEQRDTLGELHDVLEGSLPARQQFRLAIELASTEHSRWHRLNVRSEWIGSLPANAFVTTTASYSDLEAAYDEPACIYRELIPGEAEELADAYAMMALRVPVLRYRSEGVDFELEGVREEGSLGRYSFNTKAAESAHCHLFVAFPYPANVPCYPIFLNRYSVQGTAYITINLNRVGCRWLETVVYGYHSRARFHIDDPSHFERVVTIGTEGEALPQGVGAVFIWQA